MAGREALHPAMVPRRSLHPPSPGELLQEGSGARTILFDCDFTKMKDAGCAIVTLMLMLSPILHISPITSPFHAYSFLHRMTRKHRPC